MLRAFSQTFVPLPEMGGARGNALLTSLTGAVLLVLLAIEGATIPRLTLHRASFLVWFRAMTVHVLAYGLRVGRRLLAEAMLRVAGRGYRLGVALLAIAAGVVTALAAYSLPDPWLHGMVA